MRYVLAVLQAVVAATFVRRWAHVCVWIVTLLSSFVVVGCGPTMRETPLQISKEQVRLVCWEPAEVQAAKEDDEDEPYFAFPSDDGIAVTLKDRLGFRRALSGGGFVFKYNAAAPVRKLKLLPLSRAADAWCSRIPKPTEEAVRKLLDPCSMAASMAQEPAAKNLLGQTEATPHSSIFCNKLPRMAPTTQESITVLQRNIAYMSAQEQARKIATALTLAEADMKSVLNNDRGWCARSAKRFYSCFPDGDPMVRPWRDLAAAASLPHPS